MSILTNGRIPIIPLPYEYKHMAVKRELVIDEKEKKLYLVSSENSSKLIDITQSVIEHIKDLDGNIINVEIQGVGIVNLKEFLNLINKSIENSVNLQDVSEVKYVAQTKYIDKKSLTKHFNKIEINGFAKAPNRTIPMKKDGKIEWVSIYGLDGEKEDNSSIDSCYGNVYEIIPQNRRLYPIISKRQKTSYIIEDCAVVLPTPLSDYCSIEWCFLTGDFAPNLTFPDNVYFKDANKVLPNCKAVFEFRTFDGGDNWLGDLNYYTNTNSNTSEILDFAYINNNYYNKDEIDEKLKWKYQ